MINELLNKPAPANSDDNNNTNKGKYGGKSREAAKTLLSQLILIMADLTGVSIAIWIGYQTRIYILPKLLPVFPTELPPAINENIWWIWGIITICFYYEKLYSRRLSFWRETKRVIVAITLSFIMIMAIVSLGKMSSEISRTVLLVTYMAALFVIPLCRYLVKYLLARVGIWCESIIIMGTGDTAKKIGAVLQSDWYMGYRVTGFIEELGICGDTDKRPEPIPIIGCIEDTVKIIASQGIRHLIIAVPNLSGTELVAMAQQLQPHVRSLWIVPDLPGMPIVGGEIEYFFDDQILAFRTRNNLASKRNLIGKRIFDLLVTTLMLLLVIPVFVILALLIKLDSPGPVIYAGKRIGRLGREFKCYKFRTMYLNNDIILEEYLDNNPEIKHEWELYAKIRGEDPRVTRMGKILRKLSLDELPQFINIIKGEMSLVGARPYLPQEKDKMGEYADTILLAYPGITGLWQVSGRNELDFFQRVQIEVWYVRNWSLWLDISILFRTIPVALKTSGAY